MKRNIFILAALGLLAAGSGCMNMTGGRDAASVELDKETSADDVRVLEDKTRTSLSALESAVSDYVKTESRIPEKLDLLIPRYLSQIPSLDIPACGGESNKVQNYPPSILRDGQVDGSAIRGTGRWGYVYNDSRVVVFIDCLKPTSKGLPWYQVRGIN
jgi:hypothetical protein